MVPVSTQLISALVSVPLVLLICARQRSTQQPHRRGYVLHNKVTHARHRPVESKLAFTYPTISLFVSLEALENHSLDLARGWLFAYGSIFGCLLGLRSKPYLERSPEPSIRRKLEGLLSQRGFSGLNAAQADVWMMTMPSILGFEGINPLTVYFCYKHQFPALWLIVLEIHNTFGESHLHVLEVGQGEDSNIPQGYSHSWTFRREFHVSPFNDRSGFYSVQVHAPNPYLAPTSLNPNPNEIPNLPAVRVRFYEDAQNDTIGPLKLTAVLRSTAATPLSSSAVLSALARAPFLLFLTMPRILYVAWKLHYVKRLSIYPRPDPLPRSDEVGGWNNITKTGGGVKWIQEGLLHRFARNRTEGFLRARVMELPDLAVVLVPGDRSRSPHRYGSENARQCLTIHYRSSDFFTLLFRTAEPCNLLRLTAHADSPFYASSPELFRLIFGVDGFDKCGVRRWARSCHSNPPSQPILPSHPLNATTTTGQIADVLILLGLMAQEATERVIFRIARVRVANGHEPWGKWDEIVRTASH